MSASKSYSIRAAGSAARLGNVWKTYPYDLRSLVLALEEASSAACPTGRMGSLGNLATVSDAGRTPATGGASVRRPTR